MDAPLQPTPPKESSVGPIAGIIIIVAVLIAGGIYFLMMEQQEREQEGLENTQASNSDENLVVSPNAI